MKEYRRFSIPERFGCELNSGKLAAEYLRWFVDGIPGRLEQVALCLRRQSPSVDLDFSVNSLVSVGRWLDGHVSTRSLSSLERSGRVAAFPTWAVDFVPDWTLTDDCLSVAVDVGIYFGELIRYRFPKLHWDYIRKPKNHVDFHLPVLVPFTGNTSLNPVRISVNVAFGSLSGEKAEKALPEVYEYWASHAPV